MIGVRSNSISLPIRKKPVNSATRAACCMLCVTITCVHYVLQAEHQIFDLGRRDGVERRARLVEQQHFRIHRQRARDAQALLLAARERIGRLVQLVLHFVPQRGPLQAVLHFIVQRPVALEPVDADSIGDVVEDRFGERIRPLEHHAHAAAQVGDIHAQHVFAIQRDRSFGARAANHFVDAVEGSQEGRFAAAGRSDQSGDLLFRNLDVDIVQRLKEL